MNVPLSPKLSPGWVSYMWLLVLIALRQRLVSDDRLLTCVANCWRAKAMGFVTFL